jgi:hypothetical protein
MRKLIIILFIFGFNSCDRKQHPTTEISTDIQTTEIENKLFKEFMDSIPSRQTPIFLSCGLPNGSVWVDQFEKYKEFLPKDFNLIYGSIDKSEKFKCIIFGQIGDDIYPTLFTYDNNGKIIDSLFLILSPCGAADEHQIPYSVVRIDKDFKITLQDTVKYIHYPDNQGPYILDSLKTSTINYKINKDGQIEKS